MQSFIRRELLNTNAALFCLILLSCALRGTADVVRFRHLQDDRVIKQVTEIDGNEATVTNDDVRVTELKHANTRRLFQFRQSPPQRDAYGRSLYMNDPRQQQQQPNQFGEPMPQSPPPSSGIQFDPVNGQAYIIDPSTGQRQLVDPNTGLPVQQTPPVQYDSYTGQYFMLDPATGQRVLMDPRTGRPVSNQVTNHHRLLCLKGVQVASPQGSGFLEPPPPPRSDGFIQRTGTAPVRRPVRRPVEEYREGVRLQFDTSLRKTFVVDPETGQRIFIGFETGEVSVKLHIPSGRTYVRHPETRRAITLQMRVDPGVLEMIRGVLEGTVYSASTQDMLS